MKAFIFDFDGVIVDSEYYWDSIAFDAYREIVPSFTREDEKKLKGRNARDIHKWLVADFNLEMTLQEYTAYIEDTAAIIYGKCQPLPGVFDLVTRLREMNIPMGIASSSERKWIEPVIERIGLGGEFSPIVMAADAGIGKPDPAVYLLAAKKMNVDPSECVAIEDSTNGIRSAKSAGMTCIALKHLEGYEQDLSEADIIVRSFDELTTEVLGTL